MNIALGNADVSACLAGDANHDMQITIDEILTSVNNALNGCPAAGTQTATPTPTAPMRTATSMSTPTCPTSGPSQAGSIVVFENLQVNATSDPVLTLTNTSHLTVHAQCFYADTTQPACTTFGFNVQLNMLGSVQWRASGGGPLPGTGIPFSGELVCIEVDEIGQPLPGNDLIGSSQNAEQCPIAATGIGGSIDKSDGDNVLCLGRRVGPSCPNGAEYGSCPADLGPDRIEGCWSQSPFTFVCATTATNTPTATPTATPAGTPPATRTVAPAPGAGPVSAYVPGSIIVYPYVGADRTRGLDTIIQLSNASDQSVSVRCFYENATSHCSKQPGLVCAGAADCAGGSCVPGWSTTDFTLSLAAGQPLGWPASQGRLDVPNNISAIPALPEDPFTGVLRCATVDGSDVPIGVNALRGAATVETFQASTGTVDVAKYNALGIPALTTGDGGASLDLDGSEFTSCPNFATIAGTLPGAPDPALDGFTVQTIPVLVSCGADLQTPSPVVVNVHYLLINEFSEQFTASRQLRGQQAIPLSDIAPVFSAAMAGSGTGQTRITGQNGGVMAVVLERHQGASQTSTSGVNVYLQGVRFGTDRVLLPTP